MKIRSLKVTDFGIYAGNQRIDFTSTSAQKPIVLLGGYNGRGKTTILEAILLCLYGNKSYAFVESKLSYPNYLNKFINKTNGNKTATLELDIVAEIDKETVHLNILRQWIDKGNYTKEDLRICKNAGYDSYLTDNWENEVEYIMPVGMSKFFLFDGERIAELIEDVSGNKLKQAIKTLLGIDIIEKLSSDLKTLSDKNEVTQELEQQDGAVKRLKVKYEVISKRLQELKQKRDSLSLAMQQDIDSLKNSEAKFSKKGGKLFENYDITAQSRVGIERELKEIQAELYERLAGFAPLMLVRHLLREAWQITTLEESCRIAEYEIHGIEEFLSEIGNLPKAIREKFEKKRAAHYTENDSVRGRFLNISHVGVEQIQSLVEIDVDAEFLRLNVLLSRKNELQNALSEKNKYLTVEIDREGIEKIINEIKTYNVNIAKYQLDIERVDAEVETLNKEFLGIEQSLERLTELFLAGYKSQDSSVRLVRYSAMAQRVLAEYKRRIQQMKVRNLSEKVTEKFMRIIGKKTLIRNIIFDEAELSMSIINEKGDLVIKNQLSAGEQQLLSTAIIWGIIECTGQEFPMIIDTPLARLDSTHRDLFMHNYLPNAGHQVIILSTDAEIVGELEKIIDGYVAKKYLLEYDEATKATKIAEGYFGGII